MGADSAHVGGLRESLGGNQAGRLCPWPGLPELSWSRRVHTAGWVAAGPPGPLESVPQIIAGHYEGMASRHISIIYCADCPSLVNEFAG